MRTRVSDAQDAEAARRAGAIAESGAARPNADNRMNMYINHPVRI